MDLRTLKAVVLDLFDTLVRWEPERLPLIEWRGSQVRSTVPWLLPKLKEVFGPRLELDPFLEVFYQVTQEIVAQREREGTEITCLERFTRTLRQLDFGSPPDVNRLAADLRRLHMAEVRRATIIPAERVEAAKRIAGRYRLGLLSNFDDSETGHQIVRDTGIAELFEAVIISADAGLRKPNRQIFEQMSRRLGLDPSEILFVGDMPEHDVAGSQRSGMRAAWVNDGRAALPEGLKPDLIVRDLPELAARLGC